jgi:putative ABC transport system permease protein
MSIDKHQVVDTEKTTIMVKHSLRILNRQKGYLLINIAGLSIGIACSLIIALFILHEVSYDQFHEKKDRLYRMVVHGIIGDREVSYAVTSAPVGPTVLREFPEVEGFTRINILNAPTIKYQEKKFTEDHFIESDSSFFELFSIPLLRGDKNNVLNTPNALVISQSTAIKLFDQEDPIGKVIQVGNKYMLYTVTGIMADIPDNSHFTCNMIGSFMTNPDSKDTYWANNNYATYILLKTGVKPEQVNARMPGLIRKYMGTIARESLGISIDEFISKYKYNFYLQPIKDIHFDTEITQLVNTKPASNRKYLYIFGCAAILIILVAAINFMNLSTAQALKRVKEVGIKRASGSSKGMLIKQFLSESVLLSLISLVLAIIIIENVLPYFSNLLGIKLQMKLFGNWYTLPALLTLSVFVGLFAGSYPAFYLSSFNPVAVLKGKPVEKTKIGKFRNILVILQFSISIILIAGTIIMSRQIRYMLNKDLGFNKEQLMVIARADAIGKSVKTFKEAILKTPDVIQVTSSTAVPGHSESGRTYSVEGRDADVMDFKINFVDYDFFQTYDIRLASGRAFNESFADEKNACIVNESTINQLSITDPLNTNLVDGFSRLSIIGVVNDFHYESLQHGINPYIFKLKGDSMNYGYITVRLSANATTESIKNIEKLWDEFALNDPFHFFFLDQDFAQKYKEEKQNAILALVFSIMAIFIASIGLFGLMSFNLEQKTKEIGIRKAMGASIQSIFYEILKELLILVCIATIISWPVIYLVMKNWLQSFYYRINLGTLDFLASFLIAVVIALITIGYRTLYTAKANPVEALRYE